MRPARTSIILLAFTVLMVAGGRSENVSPPRSTNFPQPLQADAFYHSTWEHDARYPLLEVYLPNPTQSDLVWSNAWLNGTPITAGSNGVLWTQWYPSEKAAKDQTTLLQISLALTPMTNQVIQVQTAKGQKYEITTSPDATPVARITGIGFNSTYDRAYVTYEGVTPTHPSPQPLPQGERGTATGTGAKETGKDAHPTLAVSKVWVNGKSCARSFRMVQIPDGKQPGMLAVTLPEPLAQGRPFHIQLGFTDGTEVQSIVRALLGQG